MIAQASLSQSDWQALEYGWRFWQRDAQAAPDWPWLVWLVMAGRGFGKSRTGAEWVRQNVELKGKRRVALVARTAADARDVMIEGESGILSVSPPWFRPDYYPSKRRLVWPNGAIATCYSSDKPDALRGPQFECAWMDEFAAFRYAQEVLDNLQMGLRLGELPQLCITTTPRPIKALRMLIKDKTTAVTGGTTYENIQNLSAHYQRIIKRFEGTTLGKQELLAVLLEDIPGALWQHVMLDELRVPFPPTLQRIVVAIDPATTSKEDSDDTGMVVAGLGIDGHGYVLDDITEHSSPNEWASSAIAALKRHKADRIVAEVNNGGDLVETVLRTVDPNVPYMAVHASRGKLTRAEPIAALYEQGKVHHVGTFPELEDQMCTWLPLSGEKSPDRMDALVWALTELMIGSAPIVTVGGGTEMPDRGP